MESVSTWSFRATETLLTPKNDQNLQQANRLTNLKWCINSGGLRLSVGALLGHDELEVVLAILVRQARVLSLTFLFQTLTSSRVNAALLAAGKSEIRFRSSLSGSAESTSWWEVLSTIRHDLHW